MDVLFNLQFIYVCVQYIYTLLKYAKLIYPHFQMHAVFFQNSIHFKKYLDYFNNILKYNGSGTFTYNMQSNQFIFFFLLPVFFSIKFSNLVTVLQC